MSIGATSASRACPVGCYRWRCRHSLTPIANSFLGPVDGSVGYYAERPNQ
jgi:hypothetical protein